MIRQMARLLVVDDEQDTCSNLSDLFTDLGFQVDVALGSLQSEFTYVSISQQLSHDESWLARPFMVN